MECSFSDEAAMTLGRDSETEGKIVALVHEYIGLASAAFVSLTRNPEAVEIRAAGKTVTVDRELTHRVEQYC
jgi:hypothetical protein